MDRYTSLLMTGPREAIVTYNLYFDPRYGGGTDGCMGWPAKPHAVDCSKGFAMRITVEEEEEEVGKVGEEEVYA